jgi:hypothetical protein
MVLSVFIAGCSTIGKAPTTTTAEVECAARGFFRAYSGKQFEEMSRCCDTRFNRKTKLWKTHISNGVVHGDAFVEIEESLKRGRVSSYNGPHFEDYPVDDQPLFTLPEFRAALAKQEGRNRKTR